MKIHTPSPNYVSTRNACKLCTPLGACMVFKGVEGCVPFLHGSQGCATYIRRYMISHYKEPVDIASSNFGEQATIFGGQMNLETGLKNIIQQYNPAMVGIASTCLSETIGDDVSMILREFLKANQHIRLPHLVNVSTPSYQGTHMNGFHATVKAIVLKLAHKTSPHQKINIFPGFVSPEDLRFLKQVAANYQIPFALLPDYSESLDGSTWNDYHKIPRGGTRISDIEEMPGAPGSITFGHTIKNSDSAGKYLWEKFQVPHFQLGLPIGIRESDRFYDSLNQISGLETPQIIHNERGRLIDAFVDGHKYVFGKKAIIYGEEDLMIGLISLLDEMGIQTILCASGGESGKLKKKITELIGQHQEVEILEGMDFEQIASKAKALKPDLLIGNSKGYYIARELGIPIIRVGFPIHDRIGAQRILHLGYGGALNLFDQIANHLIAFNQDHSPIGYKYM
ncbi:MAG: nitrogenase component 1 [Candidatus Cyclobacteriaceae bacterium M3_2C_046]